MSRVRRVFPLGFDDPFPKNHCVVVAFTAVQPRARRTTEFALALAAAAYETPAIPRPFAPEHYLLHNDGWSRSTELRMHAWCQLAGLQQIGMLKPTRTYSYGSRRPKWYYPGEEARVEVRKVSGLPTLAQFCKSTGRRGSWIVLVRGHAVAVVSGKPRGICSLRARVQYAARVEPLAEPLPLKGYANAQT